MDTIPQNNPKRQPRKEPIFYVYFFYRGESTVPFYIGKGCRERINGHETCARNHPNCKHLTCRIIRKEWHEGKQIRKEKIADGITERAALDLERLFISIGTIYQWPLVNKTFGGEGVSGYVRDAEWRKRRSELAKRLAKEGKFDHLKTVNKGRKHTPEVEQKRIQRTKEAWSNPELIEQQRQRTLKRYANPDEIKKQKERFADPELRAKCGAANLGKISPKAKTYPGFIAPDGTVFRDVKNLTHFCRAHNLQIPGMCRVAQDKQPSHKGWTKYRPETIQPPLL